MVLASIVASDFYDAAVKCIDMVRKHRGIHDFRVHCGF